MILAVVLGTIACKDKKEEVLPTLPKHELTITFKNTTASPVDIRFPNPHMEHQGDTINVTLSPGQEYKYQVVEYGHFKCSPTDTVESLCIYFRYSYKPATGTWSIYYLRILSEMNTTANTIII